MALELIACFQPEYIEKTAKDIVETLPMVANWDGCTRLDVANTINVPVHLLEKAMGLNEELNNYILLMEQKSLQTDINKLKYQMTEKKINSPLVKLYFGAKHGLTDRNIDELMRKTNSTIDKPGGLRVIIQGPNGETVNV